MKKSLLSIILLSVFILGQFQLKAQDLPKPSPSASVKQQVGLTDVEITYSRPGVKDRVIFGDLVPYNEMWRTGANKATAISFSTDVMIMGNELKAGTYAIFTIPGESEWEVIFNNNTEQWGTSRHKDEEDVLKVKVKSNQAEYRESMLFYFDDLRDAEATINLHWDKTKVTIPMTVDSKEEAVKNIDEAIADAESQYSVYNGAARYYLDNDMDAAKALEWAKKSVSMAKKYWNLTTLSRAQAANDMKKEAIKTAEEAKALAAEANSKGYIMTNEANIAKWKSGK